MYALRGRADELLSFGMKNIDIANTRAILDKFEPIALPIASIV
tara:strand:+ start:10937 stop:11065 length:129 start_codon:yes stop_codon:yes gene_type:complete